MLSMERKLAQAALQRIAASHGPSEGPDGVWEIELNLRTYADAFQTLVPLPLPYLNIDPDIVEYVEEQMEEIPKKSPGRLVLGLPAEEIEPGDEETVRRLTAIYFEQRNKRLAKEEREALKSVFSAVFWGFVFMLFCQIVRWLADFPEYPTITQTISEGMLVLGWVALWNPYDRLLFTWWPAVKQRRLMNRIAELEVVLRPLAAVMPEEFYPSKSEVRIRRALRQRQDAADSGGR